MKRHGNLKRLFGRLRSYHYTTPAQQINLTFPCRWNVKIGFGTGVFSCVAIGANCPSLNSDRHRMERTFYTTSE